MSAPPCCAPRIASRPARSWSRAAATGLALSLCLHAGVQAQDAPPGDAPPAAYRGLFGASDVAGDAPARAAASPGVLYGVGVSSLFESQVPSIAGADGLDTTRRDNTHTALSAAFTRHIASRRVTLDVVAGSQLRRYYDERGLTVDRQSSSAILEARVTRRSTLTLTTSASYSPTYTLSVPLTSQAAGPDAAPPPGIEVNALRSAGLAAGARWSRRTGHQSTMDIAYDVTRVAFVDRGTADLTQRLSFRASRDFRRGVSARVRYDYGRAASHPSGMSLGVTTHEIEVGTVYVPARSPGTRIAFSVRPTAISRHVDDVPASVAASVVASQPTGQGLRVGAAASVEHQLGDRWRFTASYQRALYSNEGFAQPAFAQTVATRVEGRISRRVKVDATAAYSLGLPNPLTPLRPLQDSLGWAARWSVAATRTSVVFAEYQRTTYLEAGPLGGSSATLANLDRQGLRVGVTLSLQRH